jgi:hypothetical protein
MTMVMLKGTFTSEGTKCQAFRSEDGRLFWAVGDVGGQALDTEIFVIGTLAETSVCGSEPTIVVSWSGRKLPTLVSSKQAVTRDIDVTATHSVRDPSPTFKLEGNELPLTFDNETSQWRGNYKAVLVTGALDVLFISGGTNNQKFDVTVTTTDPGDPGNPKTKTLSDFARKGSVVIQGEIEV